MITIKDIKDFACKFHCNGVLGIGFYACSFKVSNISVRVIVFDTDDKGFVAVFSNNKEECFRGDNYEDALRSLIKVFNEA